MVARVVDLPDPDGPMIAVNSPRRIATSVLPSSVGLEDPRRDGLGRLHRGQRVAEAVRRDQYRQPCHPSSVEPAFVRCMPDEDAGQVTWVP